VVSLDARLSRRRFLALAGAATVTASMTGLDGPPPVSASTDVIIPAPYFTQGGTGKYSAVNCGPATVAAAVNYSGVAYPTVADVRATLGGDGPTNIDQWAWLLSWYGATWYSTWSRWEIDEALRTGHVLVVAAWMADFSLAPDYEVAWSANWGQSGRYTAFAKGHALLVVGTAEDGQNYVVHDPNVFADGTYWYGDGSPKGAYRKYNADELWYTIARYANGQALAVAPPPVAIAPPKPVKRIRPELGQGFDGPGGGHTPIRGLALTDDEGGAQHGADRSPAADSDA
jgi:hypothetical protein